MLRYIGRRLLQTIPVFFGATFLIFAMVHLMPGDPVAALGGDKGLTEKSTTLISLSGCSTCSTSRASSPLTLGRPSPSNR